MAQVLARSMPQLVFAVAGALVFAGSLLFFAASYGWLWDGEPAGDAMPRVTFNVILFTLFAMHHSIFARAGVKSWLATVWPPELERSLYVWIASLLFLSTCGLWQPVPGMVWDVEGGARLLMRLGQLAGVVLIIVAARRLDVLELSGVLQVLDRRFTPATRELFDRGIYAFVRHPLYLGWTAMVWLAPTMNGTRLVFAIISTVYLAAAIPFEEHDLKRSFGPAYQDYTRRVRWRMIPFLY